jgi:hypothetical protein
MYKWFGLTEPQCETCEVLREQLAKSESERRDLLHRLIDPVKTEPPQTKEEEFKPITPQFTPWRVRQEMLEAEDRKKATLMKEKAKEIAELEKELGVTEVAK